MFEYYLLHIETVLNKAFNRQSIFEAWENCGYTKGDPNEVLSGYAHWSEVSQEDAAKILGSVFINFHKLFRFQLCLILRAIPIFAKKMEIDGQIDDEFIFAKLRDLKINTSQFEQRLETDVPLSSKHPNQRRVCWLTSPNFRNAEETRRRAPKVTTTAKGKRKSSCVKSTSSKVAKSISSADACDVNVEMNEAPADRRTVCFLLLPFDYYLSFGATRSESSQQKIAEVFWR